MRVVSWNMQGGKKVQMTEAIKLFEKWTADVVLVQEPSSGLMKWGRSGDEQQPRGCDSKWFAHTFAGGSQGTIVIVTRGSIKALNITNLGPLQIGQGTKKITDENPLVSVNITSDSESLKVATCHAPFDQSVAKTYIERALKRVRESDQDFFIGDFNTYGVSMPKDRSSTYSLLLASPTSNKGKGFALDKIVGKTKYLDIKRGRIVAKGKRIKKLETNKNISDIEELEWQSKDVPSDHLPIWFDTQRPTKKLKLEEKKEEDEEKKE